jgi:hypothetical protein
MKNNNLGWIRGGAGLVIKKLAALETKTLLIVVVVLAARLVCSQAQSVLLASAAASLNVTVPTQSYALWGNQLPGGAGAGNTNTGTDVFMIAWPQSKISRHGSEMGVFSEQLENPGFKMPCRFRLF